MLGRRLRIAVPVVLAAGAALALGACSDAEPSAGEARFSLDGEGLIVRSGGEEQEVTGSGSLGTGDRFRVRSGTARLDIPGDGHLEVRAGGRDAAVVIGERPEVEAGDVLLVAGDDPLTVRAAGTDVTVVDGAARVTRGLGVSVGTYEGVTTLDSAGEVREVPAYRRMHVAALGRPPRSVQPLRIDEDDAWDRRFLGEVIDLSRRLDALAAGYTANVSSSEVQSVAFYRRLVPGLSAESGFTDAMLSRSDEPGELLIGAAITTLGRRGDFADRWEQVFDFREAGATWGMVAHDQGVSADPLLEAVEDAVTASPLEFAAPPTTLSPDVAPDGAGGDAADDGSPPVTDPLDVPVQSPPTTAPPTTAPPTTAPPEEPPSIASTLDPLLDPTTDVVEGLVGGLVNALLPVIGR